MQDKQNSVPDFKVEDAAVDIKIAESTEQWIETLKEKGRDVVVITPLEFRYIPSNPKRLVRSLSNK
ncbi:hypothetical protein WJ0W_006679 [Paenibacillus melissococcoides]|uniref:Uncharacterized protein n=1 Tax=Paenibacillus melissococcoides TaxID=2912268 RepID=A0ABN8UEF1_9BACL|nr:MULTISPECIES: hypothetical protein [Paenibacillus]MEB9895710.1 hypothetical protein [Bacillus cereus]GIO81551.1 hypothetical protein J6TS7_51610 [Paenibacillus dendritiformis]CAH8249494.1 hypothetical protein WJ0W_006679 [Paenibacillus melissococcoides]CAH8721199.1 hypothetical protein HTL2_006239 [Paenibacillus melissococcoides]